MRPRLAWLVVVALILPARAYAHGHTWDGSGGPITTGGSTLYGFRGTLGITLPPVNHDWSALADFTNTFGNHDDKDVTQLSYMGGARRFLNGNGERHLFSLHIVGGVVHRHEGETTTLKWATSFGGAYELIPRGVPYGWATRFQLDRTAVQDQKDFYQFSVSIVKRFQ
jgi:hypothetical protein